MELKVPLRKLEIYQAEDGRRIEVYTKRSEIPTEFDDKIASQIKFVPDPVLFLGVAVTNPKTGQEIKFRIPNVNTAEEAVMKYKEALDFTMKELEKRAEAEKKRKEAEEKNSQRRIYLPLCIIPWP